MKVTEFSGSKTVRQDFQFQYVKLTDKLYVYKLSSTSNISLVGFRNGETQTEDDVQGIGTRSVINSIRKDGTIPKPSKKTKHYAFITDVMVEGLRQYGFPQSVSGIPDIPKEWSLGKILSDGGYISTHPFDDFVNEKVSLENLVWYDYGHRRYVREDGTIVPSRMLFNYSSGMYDNGHYRLDEAVKVLREIEGVTFYREIKYDGGAVVADVGDEINEIPHYNAENRRDKHLIFTWCPSEEQMKAIYAEADRLLHSGDKPPVVDAPTATDIDHAIFVLDIFGLRKAGAAHFDNYFKCRSWE